ncbi:hypothetical protein LMB68_00680 [Limosilactobacillus reuteri]|uniref:YbaK/EbsC family protein n=1 Tax=Limosilactobacillus reuteri TaxID=1598 RepID=UPI0039854440|nr:hypothetical protein [Limosilactobacillus reuteri]
MKSSGQGQCFSKINRKYFYLLVIGDKKRLDFHEFQDLTRIKWVSMAHNHYILEKLGLYLGFISPFELMNDDAYNVRVLFDKEMLANRS